MKRKLFTRLFAGILFLGLAFAATSCSDSNDDIVQTQWKIIDVSIRGTDWKLVENQYETFYQAAVNLPELTQFVFNSGASIGYYKLANNAKTQLPFVKTTVDSNGIPYTETYSCDFQSGNPSTVVFTLESSDAGKYDGNPPPANFQIVLIW